MELVELNVKRLEHLMALFGVSKDELLSKISDGLVNPLTEKDVFTREIKLSTLKKIDKIFNKGLVYYIDPSDPIESKSESIFFRKDRFNANLNLGAKRLVNRYEDDKLLFMALSSMVDYNINRKIPVYQLTDKAKEVAEEVREYLYPIYSEKSKQFLKNFINQLAEYNILVFESIEHPATKEKANIKGMFLSPNVIVLNRNKDSYKQEIFTLAHELGHYLLNQEEIDDNIATRAKSYKETTKLERWCSDFAYYFLAGEYNDEIDNLNQASPENDYHHDIVNRVSQLTQLSRTSIYTRLMLNETIESGYYARVIENLDNKFLESKVARAKKLEEDKRKAEAEGKVLIIPPAKPIMSPLYERTLKGALYNGLITEKDFCQKLNINPRKLDKHLT